MALKNSIFAIGFAKAGIIIFCLVIFTIIIICIVAFDCLDNGSVKPWPSSDYPYL